MKLKNSGASGTKGGDQPRRRAYVRFIVAINERGPAELSYLYFHDEVLVRTRVRGGPYSLPWRQGINPEYTIAVCTAMFRRMLIFHGN